MMNLMDVTPQGSFVAKVSSVSYTASEKASVFNGNFSAVVTNLPQTQDDFLDSNMRGSWTED